MAVFLVSYDLAKPETHEDYKRLWARLGQWNARRVLYSEWLVAAANTVTPTALRDDLLRFMDANDTILVVNITQAAWRRLMIDDAEAKVMIEHGG